MSKPTEAYTAKNGDVHRPGSRKGKIHEIFDSKGREAAIAAGEKLKLQHDTLLIWTSGWARGTAAKAAPKAKTERRKAAPKSKPAAKAKAKRAPKAASAPAAAA